MYQSVTLVGNVGRDCEMRFTPAGKEVSNFSVAISRKWGDGQEKTVWFRVTAWGKLAEITGQYVKKGMRVLVVGEIEAPRIYTDKDGNPATNLEITAQTVRFLSSKDEDGDAAPTRTRRPAQEPNLDDMDDMDDIPF